MRTLLLLLCVFWCAGCSHHSQTATADLHKRVDQLFSPFSSNDVTPGCAVGLFDRTGVVLAKGYGLADLSWRVPITADVKFELGSAAKQFTALSILMLEADGRLSRHDPARKLLPHLPRSYDGITLDHLLRHTSGIADYIQLARIGQAPALSELTRENALELANSVPALFSPGEDFAYSNAGYLLLADVVGSASGMTFGEFVQTRIFRPLGMNSSEVIDASLPSRARATFYEIDGEAARDGEWRGRDAPGAWGVRSTIHDLGRYHAALADKNSVLAPYMVGISAEGRLNSGEVVTYGAGVFAGSYRGKLFLRHSGRSNVEFMRFPELGRAIALMCNRNDVDAEKLAEDLADIFLDQSLQPPAPRISAEQHASLLGSYISSTGEDMHVVEHDGYLELDGWGPLREIARGVFTAGPSTDSLRLTFSDGSPPQMTAEFQSSKPTALNRYSPTETSRAEFEELLGQYRNDSLRSIYSVELSGDGDPVLVTPDRERLPLEPLTPDRFTAGPWRVAVQRSLRDSISGLEIRSSRTPALTFPRTALSDAR